MLVSDTPPNAPMLARAFQQQLLPLVAPDGPRPTLALTGLPEKRVVISLFFSSPKACIPELMAYVAALATSWLQ